MPGPNYSDQGKEGAPINISPGKSRVWKIKLDDGRSATLSLPETVSEVRFVRELPHHFIGYKVKGYMAIEWEDFKPFPIDPSDLVMAMLSRSKKAGQKPAK